jgi:Flp pilus assembly CpaF family ATPase
LTELARTAYKEHLANARWVFLQEGHIGMDSSTTRNELATTGMSDSLTQRIITTVAEEKGQSIDELEPLYNAINPEALESLFASRVDGSSRPDGEVSFQYAGYWVTVSSEGAVEIKTDDR